MRSLSGSRSSHWGARWLCGGVLLGLAACKSSPSEASPQVAQLAPEPVHFQFALPAEYVPLELRGEGSETLRAPANAVIRPDAQGVRVEAGDDFALQVRFQPTSTALPAAPTGTRRALSESDLVVFERGGAYSFVVLRELIPEWDESERRPVSCSSTGTAEPAGELGPRFSRAAIERMVAACRSLALPRLD
jgi:hypothetical protein